MALIDEHETASKHARYCPDCGHLATGMHFCPGCGHAIDPPTSASQTTAEQTWIIPPRPAAAPPADASRSRFAVLIVLAVALVLAGIAAGAIILLSSSSSDQNGVYRQKLSSAVGPVVAANNTLSRSLQALHGGNTQAAKNTTSTAQQTLVAARGAVAVLTVPRASAQLSQQTQQALTEENGYLQSVSATLATPTGNSAPGLQSLASSTASAFVPLASVAPGGQVSLYGTDALVKWAQGRAAAQKRQDAVAQRRRSRRLQHQARTRP